MKIHILLGLILLYAHSSVFAQIRINEICSSNEVIRDDDGDDSDWIELYNAGNAPVNLGNYAITDNTSVPRKFLLPSVQLNPDDHIVLWASDKNRKPQVHHWETIVYDTTSWQYRVPLGEINGWYNTSYNANSWSTAKGGIGFGDNDDSTIIAQANTVYLRKQFTITDLNNIGELALHIDYDDGFTVWLNGQRAAGIFLSRTPDYNEHSSTSHEAVMYAGGIPEYFRLDKTLLRPGTNLLCVEVHNNDENSLDLTCRAFLSAGMIAASDPQFGAPPSWFNLGNTLMIHTNFKISEGETVLLTTETANIADLKKIPNTLRVDHSYGRKPSGSSTWEHFNVTSPWTQNNTESFSTYCNDTIIYSQSGGFYTGSQTISLSSTSPIRFTVDGSEPTQLSPIYTQPISISSTTVVKAICASAGTFPSYVYANTFFIDENPTLPVWSISTDSLNFFDTNYGIYVKGPSSQSTFPFKGANFWEDWERPVHVEFYEADRSQKISQGADVRIYGNHSRGFDMKSLLLKGKSKYGKSRFDHAFYFDKSLKSFEDVVLRNSGTDFNYSHFRDGFIQSVVGSFTGLDYQAYRPSLVFLNGDYWGVHDVREKIGSDFLIENHGLKEGMFDLTDTHGETIEGDNNLWDLQWIATHTDLRQESNFRLLADSFDLPVMIDYFSSQVYIANWDWPVNNVKLWRDKRERKFKYILWDTDNSTSLGGFHPSFNALHHLCNMPNKGLHADIFRSMLTYIPFRNDFINRSADLMNTLFLPSHFGEKAEDFRDSIAAEMPRHFQRWPGGPPWRTSLAHLMDFIDERPQYARNHIEDIFDLTKQVTVTLNALPVGAGIIKINTIYPETYPWSGVYFDGVPVTITAIPNPGYTFSHWTSPTLIGPNNPNQTITLNLSEGETIMAHFFGNSVSSNLVVSEVNYHSAALHNAGDWLELLNESSAALDLSGWSIRDDIDQHRFTFPTGTVIPANRRLVIAEDLSLFQTAHPGAAVVGPLGFGLDNGGESIRIFKPNSVLYKSFRYGTKSPWPLLADGLGYTLERLSVGADPSLAGSWFAGCLGGSPGYAYSVTCENSVKEITHESLILNVFPNPSKGIVQVEIPVHIREEVTIQVLDLMGKVCHTQTMESRGNGLELDLSDVNPGLYTVRIQGSEGSFQGKIILTR